MVAYVDGSNLPVPGGSLDAAAIDALIDLLGDDADVLAEVVDACLEEVPTRIAEIRAGAESGDATLVGRAAHTLKSNALTFGALELEGFRPRSRRPPVTRIFRPWQRFCRRSTASGPTPVHCWASWAIAAGREPHRVDPRRG